MRSSHRSGGEPDANPGAHRSDAACPRRICRTPAIPLHGTAFEERMDYRTRTDVPKTRRDVKSPMPECTGWTFATPSHLCPNAQVAGIRHRPGLKASRNIGLSANRLRARRKAEVYAYASGIQLGRVERCQLSGVDRPTYAN